MLRPLDALASAAMLGATATALAQAPMPDTPPRNRLGEETSPYLLQHRNNPVHWWAWGPEAFAAARELDRPVFLSIGYSTCYWCHVMERESFETDEVAAVLNAGFVAIKVDREERPDVDDVYMQAVMIFTGGHGGWPMSVFLDPRTLAPFGGGTYFPRDEFIALLGRVQEVWRTRRAEAADYASAVAARIREFLGAAAAPAPLGAEHVDLAVAQLLAAHDAEHGGWGRRQKFPMPQNVELLLDVAADAGGEGGRTPPSDVSRDARSAALRTLDRMATGGVYDQIGGGFHRYSVDRAWTVPHFEKMLYDNGQLAGLYARAHERTGDPYYAEIAREIADYLLREMTAPEGGFLSAQDAEVNHREGANYLWTPAEMREALAGAGLAGDVDFVVEAYGLDRGTNFEDPHHPEAPRSNVVFLIERPDALAARLGLRPEEVDRRLVRANAALRAVRDRREQPHTDDKIIASWNGLTIAGMADAGRILREPRFVEAAARAARFVLSSMRTQDGGLARTWRGGRARVDAYCEDYAEMIRGLLALHAAGADAEFLAAAEALVAGAHARFWDETHGGWFDTQADRDELFVRAKSTYDGTVPCAGSAMASALLDLHGATGRGEHLESAAATLKAMSGAIAEQPTGSVLAIRALRRMLREHPEALARATPPSAPPAPAPTARRDVVEIAAGATRLALAPGATAEVAITLTIARGFHVNAHEPGLPLLIPVEVVALGAGIAIAADYPEGTPHDGPEGITLVHEGSVTIPVRVTRTGELRGARLAVTYQACTDRECLAPRTVEVAVEIVER
jgi:hypothetical protein